MTKVAYRIKNWKDYNQALIDRGNLTVWIEEESIDSWLAEAKSGKRGRPCTYSDTAIETGLTLRTLWKMPLRMAQGFLSSIFELMGIYLPIPHYTTLCRRASDLQISLKVTPSREPRHLVIDSTGLKIFGEGEWHIRIHGKSKRRTWRKLHLSIDAKTHEIVAARLTTHNTHDSLETKNLLPVDEPIHTVYGDGAYDTPNAYQAIVELGAKAVIPPRSGSALMKPLTDGIVERNKNIKEKWVFGELWKTARKYHRRSLVETGMFRQKQILGDRLRSIDFDRQVTEARIRASIINKMTQLGMPKSYKIA